jgi:thiosulfate reductase cytochrome b subunit
MQKSLMTGTGATAAGPSLRPRGRTRRRAPLATILIHWLVVLSIGISLATGWRIAADAPDAIVSAALAPVLPQGTVFYWHLISGCVLLALMLTYTLYQISSGLGRRLTHLPRAESNMNSSAQSAIRWQRLDRKLHWLAFGLLSLAAMTGLLQYLNAAWPTTAAIEALHRLAAWGLVGYAIAHVGLQIAGGGLRRLATIFLPRNVHSRIAAVSMVIALGAVGGAVAMDRLLLHHLSVERTNTAPRIDGWPDDAVWNSATMVELSLANGANLPGGETTLVLKGLYDGERIYLLCEWADPTHSAAHVPLRKTERGWQIMQTAYRQADENRYYEDKLALMLASSNPMAALTSVHLGTRPLKGEPGAPGGRGLHYTTDGTILDVWHWKSVRNAYQRQADDNFFGPPLPAPSATPRVRDPDSGAWLPRYTAGYRKDPPGTYSGYEMNWEFFDEGWVLPLRLPDDPRDIAEPGFVETASAGDARGPSSIKGWIEFNDTRPYAAGIDPLPVGTLLPSVLPTGQLTGDRGDIKAKGRWSDGRWYLELSRRLDTGSKRDIPIEDGTLLWVAVFDHSQTRHAYHLRPVQLQLN